MVPLLPTFCVKSSNSRKCHLKKASNILIFYSGIYFCIFSSVDFPTKVWTFPTKVWTFPTKVWTFPTKKCPQPYCHKGFQRRKRLQKVTKGINNPYIPFFFKKQVFFKKEAKNQKQSKTIFGFYVQTG